MSEKLRSIAIELVGATGGTTTAAEVRTDYAWRAPNGAMLNLPELVGLFGGGRELVDNPQIRAMLPEGAVLVRRTVVTGAWEPVDEQEAHA